MKPALLILSVLALCAGIMPATAQEKKSVPLPRPSLRRLNDVPPPPGSAKEAQEPALLGSNYRISISAAEKGQSVGALAVQTCSAAFKTEGCLSMPAAENTAGTELILQGVLSELEGGALRLGYSLSTLSRVPTSTVAIPGTSQATSTYTFKRNGATGMLVLQPGRSYELIRISGVVYSLSITAMETWPAAPKQDAPKTNTTEPEAKKSAATSHPGPTPEDRIRYESFSEKGREKFRHAMREAVIRMQDVPEEQRRAEFRSIFDKIEAEDKARNK